MAERKLRTAPSQIVSLATPAPPRAEKSGGRAPAARPDVQKLFVLDTNVLMHDPTSLFRFEEHDIYLPMFVLEELDAHKKGVTEVARNARQASRFLDELVTSHASGTEHEGIAQGIPLGEKSNGAATGRLYLQTETIAVALPPSPGSPPRTTSTTRRSRTPTSSTAACRSSPPTSGSCTAGRWSRGSRGATPSTA